MQPQVQSNTGPQRSCISSSGSVRPKALSRLANTSSGTFSPAALAISPHQVGHERLAALACTPGTWAHIKSRRLLRQWQAMNHLHVTALHTVLPVPAWYRVIAYSFNTSKDYGFAWIRKEMLWKCAGCCVISWQRKRLSAKKSFLSVFGNCHHFQSVHL